MNRRTAVILLLTMSVILAGVAESFARPQYLSSLTEVYGEGSCETCHVIPQSDGQHDFNGTFGQYNASNKNSDRSNPNRTLLRNSYGTLFESQPNHESDPDAALMVIGHPLAAAAIPDESTSPATGTKAAPGFDLVVFVFGLSAGILLARQHNK